jgi:predicted acetyltransferase
MVADGMTGCAHEVLLRGGHNGAVTLRLRPPVPGDEAAVLAAQHELDADGFVFAFLKPGQSFTDYMRMVDDQRHGRNLDDGLVEATWLLADVDGVVVGRSSIRLELNASLLVEGGHIGYAVRPDHRRRGHATEILRQSLVVARAGGVTRALMTCDDDNLGSRKVIEANGGVLENVVDIGGVPLRRYWID